MNILEESPGFWFMVAYILYEEAYGTNQNVKQETE